MASGGLSMSNTPAPFCSKCGIEVEILNGDVPFSLAVHKQSHKTLESISTEINQKVREAQEESKDKSTFDSNYVCVVCNQQVEILNNDVLLSLQLHAQEHVSGNEKSYVRSEDQSSNSSGKSKSSSKDQSSSGTNAKRKPKPENISIMDTIFNSMPPGLKSHRGFISENKPTLGEAFCNICNAKIDSVLSISAHLKTKLHEDNTILFLKEKLSTDLHHIMEFVSFYGSNLCCNLCRCKIDLCSNNAHETIVNIVTHNTGKSHASKKSGNESGFKTDESYSLLQAIARISPFVNDNKHLIDCNMQPQFKCKLCLKNIAYNHNLDVLLDNFTAHFTSVGHDKCVKACSVLRLIETSSVPGKEKHELTASKGSIFCSICDCYVEADYDQIVRHIKSQAYDAPHTDPSDLTANFMGMSVNSPRSSSNNLVPQPIIKNNTALDSNVATGPTVSVTVVQEALTKQQVKKLLSSLPKHYHNIDFILPNSQVCGQVTCIICNCGIPASTYNLQTHLEGNRHKTNVKAVNPTVNINMKTAGLPKSEVMQDSQLFSASDQVYQSLIKTDPIIAVNSKMFAKYEDGKHFICTLCNALIEPSLKPNILQTNIHFHINSFGHEYRLKLQNELSEVNQLTNDKQSSTIKNLFDVLPASLQQNKQFIKAPEGKTFVFCSVCNLKVSAHATCLKEHLKGARHTSLINMVKPTFTGKLEKYPKPEEDTMFKNILAENIPKNQAKYLMKKDEHYFCNICKSTIIRSYDEQLTKENLLGHIKGQRHKQNIFKVQAEILHELKLSNPVIKSNKKYLRKQEENVCCTLCKCTISLSTEKEKVKRSLESHFSGSQHTNNIAGLNIGEVPSFSNTQPIPTLHSQGNSTAKEINRLFEGLPADFQDDINFIKNSTIDGYLSCSLCVSIINPHYLKEHLEEENHIQKKFNIVQSSTRSAPLNATENQKVLQNMGTLMSLLGNIDKKLSWPLK